MAAYAEPWLVPSLMMIPALDHGTTGGCPPPVSEVTWLSEVTRTVMLPWPASGWRTK